MTEPKAPSFNGVEIRKGDAGTLNVIFDEPDPSDGTIRIYVDDGAVAFDAWVGVGSIASHTPAPRPLVPGPALLDDRKHHAPVELRHSCARRSGRRNQRAVESVCQRRHRIRGSVWTHWPHVMVPQ